MQTQLLSDRTGARAMRVAASSLLALSALGVGAGATFAAPGGAIWTTNDPCSGPAVQNDNHYATGDTVFVRGENFAGSTAFDWAISGLLGGASADPGAVVASGSSITDAEGDFCLGAYVIAADDAGTYTVDVTQGRTTKNDNYRVDEAAAPSDGSEDPDDATTEGPGDETTEDPDESSSDDPGTGSTDDPTDETTTEDPADETDAPADESTVEEPGDIPGGDDIGPGNGADATDDDATPPYQSVLDETATGGNAIDDSRLPYQAVLGDTSTGGSIELPPTDTVALATTEGSTLPLIFVLAGLAGATVLFAPTRRREPDATE